MATLRGLQNQAGIGGVSVYAPGRSFAPPTRPRRPDEERLFRVGGAARTPQGGSASHQLAQQFRQTRDPEKREALKAEINRLHGVERRVVPGESEGDGQDLPWYKDALGFVVGNPVSQTLLKPLEFLDQGRRAMVLAVEEGAKLLPEPLEPFLNPLGLLVDEDREDDRSNWEKFRDPEYGFGQVTKDVSFDDSWAGGDWFDRLVGFGGDVALDPLTYVAGAGFANKGMSTAGRANRMNAALKVADEMGDFEQAARIARRGVSEANAGGRAAIGDVSGGVRLGTKSNFVTIPGSEKLLAPVSKGRGALIDNMRQTRAGRRLAEAPGSGGDLKLAYRRILFDEATEDLDLETAFEIVGRNQLKDRTAQKFSGEASQIAQRMERGDRNFRWRFSQMPKGAQRDLVRKTETDGVTTPLNQIMKELSDLAESYGLRINRRKDYIPHIFTREASRYFAEEAGDAKKWRAAAKFKTADDIVPSGVTMKREWTAGKTIDLPDGTTYKIKNGDVFEINEAFKKAGFKYDLYETDPRTIVEKYVNMLAQDVGNKVSFDSMAKQGSKNITQDPARLGKGKTKTNQVTLKGGREVQDGDLEAAAKELGLDPAEMRDVYDVEVRDKATKTYNKRELGKQRGAVQQAKAELGAARRELTSTIRGGIKVAPQSMRKYAKAVKKAQAEYEKLMATKKGQLAAKRLDPRIDDELEQLERAILDVERDLPAMDAAVKRAGDAGAAKDFEDAKKALRFVRQEIARKNADPTLATTIPKAAAKVERMVPGLERKYFQELEGARKLARSRMADDKYIRRARRALNSAGGDPSKLSPTDVEIVAKARKRAFNIEKELVAENPRVIQAKRRWEEARTQTGRYTPERNMDQDIPILKGKEQQASRRVADVDSREAARTAAEENMLGRQAQARKDSPVQGETLDRARRHVSTRDDAAIMRDEAAAISRKVQKLNPAYKKEGEAIEDFAKRIMAQNPDLSDPGLRFTQKYLNEVVDMMEDAGDKAITLADEKKVLDMMKTEGAGRVIVLRMKDEWGRMHGEVLGDNTLLSKQMRDALTHVEKAIKDPNVLTRVIEQYTNLFKTYATLTPGFHLRNAISAAFVNSSDNVPLNVQAAANRKMRQFRKAKDPKDWLEKLRKNEPQWADAFEAAWGTGMGGRFKEVGFGDRASARRAILERAHSNWATELSKRAGSRVEGAVRLAPAFDTIRRGGSIDDAVARATRLHFNYSQANSLDESMRRLVPFYTFMSRNLPMQITQMYLQPRTYARYNSLVRNAKGEDVEGTPDYFDNIGAFRLGEAEIGGMPVFLQPDLAHTRIEEDVQDLTDFVSLKNPGRLATSFNPLMTTPIEYMTKTDLYTGRRYDDEDMRLTGLPEAPIKALSNLMGVSRETPSGETAVPVPLLNAARALVPLYDRAVRLAPEATTGGADADAGNRQLESIARWLGVPGRTLSPQQQQAARRAERYEALDERRIMQALARLEAAS